METSATRRAYIGLGSNLHDPVSQVRAAIIALADIGLTRLSTSSSLYRSAPMGYADQPDFVNAVAGVDTELDPQNLLARLLAVERARGRVRTIANGPRVLDLDLLLYADECVAEAGLRIPHPRMHERAFVLIPLVEIAPSIIIPGRGSAARLLQSVDQGSIERLGT
jgi:2-amino-4-hydroxy-6-hydroxymethyldihydropteridine diphosphokinase